MNIRQSLYFTIRRVNGISIGHHYRSFVKEATTGNAAQITDILLSKLLWHCQTLVPYYAGLAQIDSKHLDDDPRRAVQTLPLLTKEIIRKNNEALVSEDISNRRWHYNTSGGSTGEPVVDSNQEYADRMGAIKILYSALAGCELGQAEIMLWGSERDIIRGGMGSHANLSNRLTNVRFLNAFYMTPDKMYGFVDTINSVKPKLIVAYTQAIYELARFIETNSLSVTPQKAVITSPGTCTHSSRANSESISVSCL